jgi:hypothetical protein
MEGVANWLHLQPTYEVKSMKATLRNRSAAALLIAPVALAALFAAGQAQAQHYPQVLVQLPTPAVVALDNNPYDNHSRRGYRQDHRAPRITDVTPDNGSRVSERGVTVIGARFHDGGSGIDPRNVTLRVDGRDVTRRTRVDNNDVRYRDDLAPGRHYAELVVRDRAGNTTRQTWSFDVAPRHWGDRGDRYGYNNR